MTSQSQISSALLLDRLSNELADLYRLSIDHQVALSALTPNAPPPQPWISAGLQGIDRLAQILSDLSRVLATLAREAGCERSLAAEQLRQTIVLQDLASRLLEEGEREPAAAMTDSGDVSWF